MHTPTGEIVTMSEAEMKLMTDGFERQHSTERKTVALTDSEVKDCESMPLYQRKGYMRNKPCVCGSGKKFKKCCWSKFK